MNDFTTLFLIALGASFLIQFWLSRRQAAHVARHRGSVPLEFRERISPEAHARAADYTLEKLKLGEFDRLLGLGLLLILTLGGGIRGLQDFWESFDLGDITRGVGLILSTFLILQLFELPLTLYQTFRIEARYGFNKTTPIQFLKDLLLQGLLGLLIGGGLLALILWVMTTAGPTWWLLAWGILMAFSVLMSWAYPTLIAPLFNRFSPLPDAPLRQRIEGLLSRCGFKSQGIFVMDGSKRSGHGNAYFTGLGDSKRIVFFDTLVDALDHDELEAVLAHELGHFRCRHVIKMLLASALLNLAGLALLGWLSHELWFFEGLGGVSPAPESALLLFILISPILTTALKPVMAHFQRRFEFEADAFAAGHTQAAHLVSALVKLYRDNASTLTPDPLYAAFHYSHPPATIRIAHLNQTA